MPAAPVSVTIPSSASAIDAAWVSEALEPWGFGPVAGVSVKNLGEGVGLLGEVARVTLTYAPGASGPATLVIKATSPAPENVFLCQMMGFYQREVSFYREVAPTLTAVRVPVCYAAAVSDDGGQFVLLLEEVAGARCPNQIEGLSLTDAERIIDTVADLHVPYWGTDEVMNMAWLPPMNNPLYKGGKMIGEANWPTFVESFGAELKPETMDVAQRCISGYPELLDWVVGLGTATLTHTDCRAENYLFGGSAGDDAITLVDFQLTTRHVGMWDVTNLVSASILPEVCRTDGERLVRRYHERINAAGISFAWDECWHQFLGCLLQQTSAQVITSNLAGGNDRGAQLLRQLNLRPLQACEHFNAGSILHEAGL
jgi:hypothetical protein